MLLNTPKKCCPEATGVSHDSPRAQTCTLEYPDGVFEDRDPKMCTFDVAPALQNTTKIPREDPQREKKKERSGGGRGKNSEILGGPAEGR